MILLPAKHGFPRKALNGLAHALVFGFAHKKMFEERCEKWNYLIAGTQKRFELRHLFVTQKQMVGGVHRFLETGLLDQL
jgi:hypothetical protein